MFYLNINNVRFSNAQMQTELNGRGTRSGEVVMGNFACSAGGFWVPQSNPNANLRNYGRYLDHPESRAAGSNVNILINGNLGGDSSTVSTGSSDGDTNFENTDTWVATDDSSNGGGDPSLAYVFKMKTPATELPPLCVTGTTSLYLEQCDCSRRSGDPAVLRYSGSQSRRFFF